MTLRPGGAVLEAGEAGVLDPGRLGSYRKLRAEAAYEERKNDPRARAAAENDPRTGLKTLKCHRIFQDRP